MPVAPFGAQNAQRSRRGNSLAPRRSNPGVPAQWNIVWALRENAQLKEYFEKKYL